jgi:hypothetical protein
MTSSKRTSGDSAIKSAVYGAIRLALGTYHLTPTCTALETGRRNWQPGLSFRDIMPSSTTTFEAKGTGLGPATPLLGHHICGVAASFAFTTVDTYARIGRLYHVVRRKPSLFGS